MIVLAGVVKLFLLGILAIGTIIISFAAWKVQQVLSLVLSTARAKSSKHKKDTCAASITKRTGKSLPIHNYKHS